MGIWFADIITIICDYNILTVTCVMTKQFSKHASNDMKTIEPKPMSKKYTKIQTGQVHILYVIWMSVWLPAETPVHPDVRGAAGGRGHLRVSYLGSDPRLSHLAHVRGLRAQSSSRFVMQRSTPLAPPS